MVKQGLKGRYTVQYQNDFQLDSVDLFKRFWDQIQLEYKYITQNVYKITG